MIAAIFSQSTLLVHCNPWILLIISAVMDVYRNFPDFNESRISAVNAFYMSATRRSNPDRASAYRPALQN